MGPAACNIRLAPKRQLLLLYRVYVVSLRKGFVVTTRYTVYGIQIVSWYERRLISPLLSTRRQGEGPAYADLRYRRCAAESHPHAAGISGWRAPELLLLSDDAGDPGTWAILGISFLAFLEFWRMTSIINQRFPKEEGGFDCCASNVRATLIDSWNDNSRRQLRLTWVLVAGFIQISWSLVLSFLSRRSHDSTRSRRVKLDISFSTFAS